MSGSSAAGTELANDKQATSKNLGTYFILINTSKITFNRTYGERREAAQAGYSKLVIRIHPSQEETSRPPACATEFVFAGSASQRLALLS